MTTNKRNNPVIDFDTFPWAEIVHANHTDDWKDGYKTGYWIGQLHSHKDLIVTMVDHLQERGMDYYDAVQAVADAMDAERYEVEILMPQNQEKIKEALKKLKTE